jgi:DNA polymerase III epsilon subunit-like protein
MLVAIDFETTGLLPGWHEPIEWAAVPLSDRLTPIGKSFHSLLRPEHPERGAAAQGTHGIDAVELRESPTQELVVDRFADWADSFNERLTPLAHNLAFEWSFLSAWLGVPLRDQLFSYRGRDTAVLAGAINDYAALRGSERPFREISLAYLSKKLGAHNSNPHRALSDAICTGEVYRAMLAGNFFCAESEIGPLD